MQSGVHLSLLSSPEVKNLNCVSPKSAAAAVSFPQLVGYLVP